ncbi:hypothetical protein MMC30_000984 [Trapelia coarctata]|nr:hypothetical protein [Trapelia coarctata]
MTAQQVGQKPFAPTVTRSSSPLKFFSSSPNTQPGKPKDSQKDWTAEFLTDLRTNRPARPSGSRPLPARNAKGTPISALEPPPRPVSAMAGALYSTRQTEVAPLPEQERSASAMSHRRARSTMTNRDQVGRPLAQQPAAGVAPRDFTASVAVLEADLEAAPEGVSSIKYFERGQRWMEKQEAKSLRDALKDMDLREEHRIHAAAQTEAADLVWKHRNSGVPYKNPEPVRDYKQHLRKGSHTRSQSISRYGVLGPGLALQEQSHRSVSDGSTSSRSSAGKSKGSRVSSGSSLFQKNSLDETRELGSKSDTEHTSSTRKAYGSLTFPIPPTKVFNSRRSSGPRSRNVSAEGRQSLFRNPGDQIYEEPEEVTATENSLQEKANKPLPLKPKNRNSSVTFKDTIKVFNTHAKDIVPSEKRFSKYEIQNNLPTQSRDPSYVQNPLQSTAPEHAELTAEHTPMDTPPTKNGLEIRSDEIRAATSMRRKDRSPKLPTPTVVSDRPGRPIVSFDRNYKPREIELKEESSTGSRPSSHDGPSRTIPNLPNKPQLPSATASASAPAIPTINFMESPAIQVNDRPAIPTINVSDVPTISVFESSIPTIVAPEHKTSRRPLPSTSSSEGPSPGNRPLPSHSSTAPVLSNKSHWTPVPHRATAQCAACALPISGRIVSAASQRFHPACFSCLKCGELLECVAFYPEPDNFREARLSRISARLNNEPLSAEDALHTEEEDGDDSLRFYCHLDYHENFSPRCRSCKTPIEGEVVVACGGEWHVGHFFCAECGDPFDAHTPFVEKDGFAWCVGCHSRRFSGKCAGCRKPVIDMVVKALGKEWHEDCFCCRECGGKFQDGRFFTRGEGEEPPFILADIGEGIKEVQIIQWFVQPGARVEQFDKLCEVQSDKAATEITSRFDGLIKKLHYEAEDMAQVGKPLCDIDIQGEISPEDEALITLPAEQTGEEVDAQKPQKAVGQNSETTMEEETGVPKPDSPGTGRYASLATPAVRGLLKELNVQIEEVQGTGKDGRVLKDDVHRFAAARDADHHSPNTKSTNEPTGTKSGSQQETSIVLTPIQSQMFKTMTRSLSIPHFLYADEVDLTYLDALRARLQAHPSRTEKFSYLPFIIKAVSVALRDYPLLNARVDHGSDEGSASPRLIMREKHNIGVAMDTPQGLLVPNIKDVASLSILDIAAQLKHLQQLAQTSKLSAKDLKGGTITVSNIGSIGGTYVSPIIVQSEVAILGVGRARVVPAFGSSGGVVRKTVGNFSWSADHRVVDGATMARMGEKVKGLIEEPGLMTTHLSNLRSDNASVAANRRAEAPPPSPRPIQYAHEVTERTKGDNDLRSLKSRHRVFLNLFPEVHQAHFEAAEDRQDESLSDAAFPDPVPWVAPAASDTFLYQWVAEAPGSQEPSEAAPQSHETEEEEAPQSYETEGEPPARFLQSGLLQAKSSFPNIYMPPRKSNVSAVSATGDEGQAGKEGTSINIEDLSLPRTVVGRLAKGVLPANTQIQKDAITAITKASTLFVNYLSHNSHAHTLRTTRRTIYPADVFMGLRDSEFDFMLPRLEAELDKYNSVQTSKRNEYRKKVKEGTMGNTTRRKSTDNATAVADVPMGGVEDREPAAKRAKMEEGVAGGHHLGLDGMEEEDGNETVEEEEGGVMIGEDAAEGEEDDDDDEDEEEGGEDEEEEEARQVGSDDDDTLAEESD